MRSMAMISTLLLLAAAGGSPARPGEASQEGVPADKLGLHKKTVFEASAPPAVRENKSYPGESKIRARAHPEAPPVVPHLVTEFLPIDAEENLCVDCHWVEEKVEGEPTPIPKSHFVDYRNAPEEVREQPVGARWVCISCHVPQTGAEPLVANSLGREE